MRAAPEPFPSRRDERVSIRCQLCGRAVPASMITLHHLTPKERGGKPEHRIELCRPCHKQVHALFGNVELERVYNTIDLLRAAPALRSFIKWIRKQPATTSFRTARSNNHADARRAR